jgi:hypothetical protein
MNFSAFIFGSNGRWARRQRAILLAAVMAVAALFLPASSRAETATTDEMTQVCENWLSYMVEQAGDWAGVQNPQIDNAQDIVINDTLVGRFYSIRPTGYVIVPVLKELAPVKAYSDENSLDINES